MEGRQEKGRRRAPANSVVAMHSPAMAYTDHSWKKDWRRTGKIKLDLEQHRYIFTKHMAAKLNSVWKEKTIIRNIIYAQKYLAKLAWIGQDTL